MGQTQNQKAVSSLSQNSEETTEKISAYQSLPRVVQVLISVAMTAAAAAVVYFLSIPNPNLILFLVLNVCLVLSGYSSGIASGIVVMTYSVFFFSTDHDLHTFTAVNAQKIAVTGVCIGLDILLLGRMYRRLEKNMEEKAMLIQHNLELDELCRIRNRHGLRNDFPSFIGQDIFVMMIDVDHFKEFNDHFGHPMGDLVLTQASSTLATWYGIDHCYRFGGDEFLLICPYASDADIRERDGKVRRSLRDIDLKENDIPLTISCGCVHGIPADDDDLRAMLRRADELLYEAKAAGRDKLVISGKSSH